MPVQDITSDQRIYAKIVVLVIGFLGAIYVVMAVYCVTSYGDSLTTPLITDKLGPNPFSWVIKILFCVNVMTSFPFILLPVHLIFENALYHDWPKSRQRQMLKNLNRTVLVAMIVGLTIALKHKLDQFVSLLGALTCAPIAFILPAMFHLKVCSHDLRTRLMNYSIIVFGGVVFIFCTGLGIVNWN